MEAVYYGLPDVHLRERRPKAAAAPADPRRLTKVDRPVRRVCSSASLTLTPSFEKKTATDAAGTRRLVPRGRRRPRPPTVVQDPLADPGPADPARASSRASTPRWCPPGWSPRGALITGLSSDGDRSSRRPRVRAGRRSAWSESVARAQRRRLPVDVRDRHEAADTPTGPVDLLVVTPGRVDAPTGGSRGRREVHLDGPPGGLRRRDSPPTRPLPSSDPSAFRPRATRASPCTPTARVRHREDAPARPAASGSAPVAAVRRCSDVGCRVGRRPRPRARSGGSSRRSMPPATSRSTPGAVAFPSRERPLRHWVEPRRRSPRSSSAIGSSARSSSKTRQPASRLDCSVRDHGLPQRNHRRLRRPSRCRTGTGRRCAMHDVDHVVTAAGDVHRGTCRCAGPSRAPRTSFPLRWSPCPTPPPTASVELSSDLGGRLADRRPSPRQAHGADARRRRRHPRVHAGPATACRSTNSGPRSDVLALDGHRRAGRRHRRDRSAVRRARPAATRHPRASLVTAQPAPPALPQITATATTAGGAYAAGTWSRTAVTVHFECTSGAPVVELPEST